MILLANIERKKLTEEYEAKREEWSKQVEQEYKQRQQKARQLMEERIAGKHSDTRSSPAPYARPIVPVHRDVLVPSEAHPTQADGQRSRGRSKDRQSSTPQSSRSRSKERPKVIWNIKPRTSSLSSRVSNPSRRSSQHRGRSDGRSEVGSRAHSAVGSVAGYSLGPAGATQRTAEVELGRSEQGTNFHQRRWERGPVPAQAQQPTAPGQPGPTLGSSDSDSDYFPPDNDSLASEEWLELQRELHAVAKKAENDLKLCKATHAFMAHQLSILHVSFFASAAPCCCGR